jgi:hypothetical protein
MYVFWDYSNMRDGMIWAVDWYVDEQYIPEISIAPNSWVGGSSGSWWAAIFNSPSLPDATYRVEIIVEGVVRAEATTTVGSAAPPPVSTPTTVPPVSTPAIVTDTVTGTIDLPPVPPVSDGPFGPITFASGINENDQPLNPGTSFPTGTDTLYAFWDYSGMEDGVEWYERWLLDGEELVIFDDVWFGGPSGSWWDSIYLLSGAPLPEGTWTLELYVDGVLVQEGSATIGSVVSDLPLPTVQPQPTTETVPQPTPQAPVNPTGPSFTNLRFAPAVTLTNQPTVVVTSLPSGSTNLYIVFDYANMQDGLTYEARWYFDGEYVPGMSWGPVAWSGGPSGTWWNGVENASGLLEGTYRVELLVEGQLLGEGTIVIGAP